MLHLRLGKLLHLALKFITFTVGITFSVVITFSGDTGALFFKQFIFVSESIIEYLN